MHYLVGEPYVGRAALFLLVFVVLTPFEEEDETIDGVPEECKPGSTPNNS